MKWKLFNVITVINRDYKSYLESKELKGNSGLVMSESVAE